MEPVEPVETVEKSKNRPLNQVGGGWYVRWVGLHLAAATLSALLLRLIFGATMWGDGVVPAWFLALGASGVFIVLGVQSYALPHPIRQDWLRWLTYGLVAVFIITYANRLLAQELFSAGSYAVFSAVYLLLNIVLTVAISGTAAYLVLRRHIADAALWFVVALGASVAAAFADGATVAAMRVLTAQDLVTFGTVIGVQQGVSTVVASLVTGGGLWWLVARNGNTKRKRQGKPPRPDATGVNSENL